MKVIFLDHDGVICLSSEWGSRFKKTKAYSNPNPGLEAQTPLEFRFDNFNKKAIKVLNQILTETGAEIVVSSDWKNFANVEEMGRYYESQGIIKKPIDFTVNIADSLNPRMARSLEIKTWLEEHPEVTHWVAIDDLNMTKTSYNSWGLDNFVLTPRSKEGIKQSGVKEKVIKFLN